MLDEIEQLEETTEETPTETPVEEPVVPTLLDEIKMIQGINHNDFDTTIESWIDAGKQDLLNIGILQDKVNGNDPLIKTAIIQFVLSNLDVVNADLYSNSYMLLKDTLRHVISYFEVVNGV